MSNSNEVEELREKFTAKKSGASYFKKLFFGTGLFGVFLSLALTGAGYFSSKPEVITRYESGKKLTELIKHKDTYKGKSITARQLYSAKDSLEYDLDELRLSNSYIAQFTERREYLRKLRAGYYSGLSLACLSCLGAIFSERREKKYEKRLEELSRLNSNKKEPVKVKRTPVKYPF
jgi:hypothetical protein